MLATRNNVNVFGLQETDADGFIESRQALAVCAHGKTAVHWFYEGEPMGLDIYFCEADSIVDLLINHPKVDAFVHEDELFERGILDEEGELQIEKVVRYLARFKPVAKGKAKTKSKTK